MVAIVQLRPTWRLAETIAGDPGRSLADSDLASSETSLALFDLPDLGVDQTSVPVLYLAASSPAPRWRSVPVEVDAGGTTSSGQTAFRKAVLGIALTSLPAGQPHLLDLVNSMQIELVDPNQWLESCDDDALVRGVNLAAVGRELIQFGSVEPIGPGRFRLSRLLRGRRGTEWAMSLHADGEAFTLIQPGTLRRLDFPLSMHGAAIEVRANGLADTGVNSISKLVNSEAMRPPCPAHLKASRVNGGLQASWVRRSREGWAWLDDMDAPIGETRELYRVVLEGSSNRVDLETSNQSVFFDASQLAALGSGSAILSVQQLGDRAASRAAKLTVIID